MRPTYRPARAADAEECVALAVLPDFENRGVGRELLRRTVEELAGYGHGRLFLGCSKDPGSRSCGFYRHLGWRSTGTTDERGDEILELTLRRQTVRPPDSDPDRSPVQRPVDQPARE